MKTKIALFYGSKCTEELIEQTLDEILKLKDIDTIVIKEASNINSSCVLEHCITNNILLDIIPISDTRTSTEISKSVDFSVFLIEERFRNALSVSLDKNAFGNKDKNIVKYY